MRYPSSRHVAAVLGLAALLMPAFVWAGEVRMEGSCGPPPPPKPAERASAETLPPLPLPATPMRRTEKKKPPEPPVIITKIKWGDVRDWATDENDVNNLLIWMKTKLKLNFTYDVKSVDELEFDPQRMPALYRTGHYEFTFTQQQRDKLRKYAINGGCIIFDACCGREDFTKSVVREMKIIFPEAKLEPVALDHPIYHCYYDIDSVQLSEGAGGGTIAQPLLSINIGCRAAVIFSPYDMSCGWDMHAHPDAKAIVPKDALRLGANLIAYSTATKTMGLSLAESRVYVDADTTKWDKFRVAQIVHEGQWCPDPAGLSTLLDTVAATTQLKISFDRKDLKLSDPAISSYPFLYITGHQDFTLSDEEVSVLRRYLLNGGFLLGDACCGRASFDAAFRRELKRALPEKAYELTALAADHAVYRRPTPVTSVEYTPAAMMKMKTPTNAPLLEGVSINGNTAVIYSPHDLGCGWELKPHPYGIGYESRSAITLGINAIVYAITH